MLTCGNNNQPNILHTQRTKETVSGHIILAQFRNYQSYGDCESLNLSVTNERRHSIVSHCLDIFSHSNDFPTRWQLEGSHYIYSHCKKNFIIVPRLSVPGLSVSIFVVPILTYYRPKKLGEVCCHLHKRKSPFILTLNSLFN